jgi:hypothetical protein
MMGVDPINYVGAANAPWPVVPTSFANLAPIPAVPGRPVPYTNPPQVYLAEDSENQYQIWPYAVAYDAGTERWYADIAPRPGVTGGGTYPPPPGYFIRLALVRFQPYSIYSGELGGEAVEVSPVVLTTFAQPVPDRTVSVITDTADHTGRTLVVTVTGPAYQGWRPPSTLGPDPTQQYDTNNRFAPQNPSIYGSNIGETVGTQQTSTMVAEVQIQDENLNNMGIEGDLAWRTTGFGAVLLPPTFSGETVVTWGGHAAAAKGEGVVKLPAPVTSSTKMRLRISEIDYYDQREDLLKTVDFKFRRPFVSHIPLN